MLKLQFNAPNSISVGAPLQTPLGELTALPRPPTWILGVLLLREARGGEEAKKGKEGEGTKRGIQFATPLGQASPSRSPGLWVT